MADIIIARPNIGVAEIIIEGTAPLIVNAWSQKSINDMLDKHMGKTVAKTIKDPEANFEASRYKFATGGPDGVPTMGFKNAVVAGAGRYYKKSGVKMTELRQLLTFLPDGYSTTGMPLTRLIYTDEPIRRQDVVRNQTKVADVRHRAMYKEWGAVLRIEYPADIMDLDSVGALVVAGGSNGICEWRPERNGMFGTFTLHADNPAVAA